MLTRLFLVGVAVAVAAVWYLALPPRAPVGDPAVEEQVVRGAIHVHTTRSDGTGTIDEVAQAASRAGLDFIIITDHGDGSIQAEAPAYRSGVLCIDGVEISSRGGHIVAIGMPTAPYPLGGESRDVVEDIHRLGGMAIAAHPGSAREELRWSDWSLPVDGLEWLNADSEWRDESGLSLVRALLAYPLRPTESVTWLLDRPADVLARWDDASRMRRVVGVAAADAHARIGPRTLGEPYDGGASIHIPGYERVFRSFSNILPGASLTGDAARDAVTVVDAIRAGHVYSRIDAVNASGTLTFSARREAADASGGDLLMIGAPLTFTAAVASAPGARIILLENGREVARGDAGSLEHRVGQASGAYRVEVSVPNAPGTPPVPWIVSNPIYVTEAAAPPAAPVTPVSVSSVEYGDGPADRWSVETSPSARAALDVGKTADGTQLAFRYALGGSTSTGAFAAAAMISGPTLPQYDRLIFTANADKPMRLSVQLRAPGGQEGERWQRSVYVDAMPREITVFFDDLRPAGATRSEHPALDAVDSVLFVVDTTNTALGSNGRVWLDDVKYAR